MTARSSNSIQIPPPHQIYVQAGEDMWRENESKLILRRITVLQKLWGETNMDWITYFITELGTLQFWSSLLTIVFIDLLLAGDNAIVIGLAARNLPKETQKKAIIWGTAGAVVIRIIATVLVVWLLEIPFLLALGGVVLLWIAYKLLVQEDQHGNIKPASTLMASIRTIIIADAAMGLDNVIAVAGAAHGSFELVVLGLLISIPIVVWGSTLFIKVIERYKWIIYIGSGVLAYTAAKMITHEKRFADLFQSNPALAWTFDAAMVALVVLAAIWTNAVKNRKAQLQETSASASIKKSRETR
jgi:YjbE family integral membrane protein